MLYSIIVPCYKSAHTIRQVVELTAAKMEEMGRTPYEFVLVDDYSPDGGDTICELRAIADDHPYVRVVELAQNAGQHNAVMAGLNYAEGDVLIAMDDDLQTHPSQLPAMFEEFDKGYDIVRDYVIQYRSHYTHLQGLFLRTTRNIASVPVEHFDRAYGSSGYTFKKLISLWSNIMGYSIVPLRIAQRTGIFFAILGIIGALAIVLKKIFAPTSAVGWYSMMVSICFFSGLIMMFLGVIGEYLGRMFKGMTNDPQFVVRQVYTGRKEEK